MKITVLVFCEFVPFDEPDLKLVDVSLSLVLSSVLTRPKLNWKNLCLKYFPQVCLLQKQILFETKKIEKKRVAFSSFAW